MGLFKKLYTAGVNKRTGMYLTNDQALKAAFKKYISDVDSTTGRKLVLRGAAAAVARLARKENYPRSQFDDREYGEKFHYAYMGSGTYRKKVRIYKGNLLKSTKYYFTRKKDYEIGPKVIRLSMSEYGKTSRSASGYYASMIFGKAWKYRQYVLEPLLERPEVFNIMQKDFAKAHARIARENDF